MTKKTGFELIGAIAERAKNEESLFRDALKKLVNASEEEVRQYLKTEDSHSPEGILWPLDIGNALIKIKALNGNKLLHQSEKLLYTRGTCELKANGVSTRETEVRIDIMFNSGTIRRIFNSLPGVWSQKWFTQNQVVEISDTLGVWFPSTGNEAFFLCKKDELLPIDDDKPSDNLVGLLLVPRDGGRMNVYYYPIDGKNIVVASSETRIFSPM